MKRWISRLTGLILAAALSLSLCVSAFAVDGGFSDVPSSHWAYDSIMACLERGAVTGFGDGTFRPEDEVTTVQFVAMVTRAFYADEVAAAADTVGQLWYEVYLKAAEDHGLTRQLPAVDEKPIDRYGMAVVLLNVLVKEGATGILTSEQFRTAQEAVGDWDSIENKYYQTGIRACYAFGILTGMSDGAFHGDLTVTRAQACTVMTRMAGLLMPPEIRTGVLANGKDATDDNVTAILDGLRESYPNGMIWDVPGTEGNHYYARGEEFGSDIRRLKNTKGVGLANVSMNYACGGFAALVSDEIFGITGAPAREVTNIKDARVGDILVWYGESDAIKHVAIVLSVGAPRKDSAGVTCWDIATANGNCDGKVRWDLDLTAAGGLGAANYDAVYGYFRIFTRYPE